MSKIRSKEYDSFGPWILAIDEEHIIPPLFNDYAHLQESAHMMFKVPRRIEWREANANMHLYDAVIGVFDTHLLLLSRNENTVTERRVEYINIQAIKNIHCVLFGELYLYTNKNIIKIKYNTVSQDIIDSVVSLIRKLQNSKTYLLEIPSINYNIKTIDNLYVNLLDKMKENDTDIELIAYQPFIILPRKEREQIIESDPVAELISYHHMIAPTKKYDLHKMKDEDAVSEIVANQPKIVPIKKERILHKLIRLVISPPSLNCVAFVTNNRDIIVISRTVVYKSRNETDYAYSYTYVPIEQTKTSICEVTSEKSEVLKFVIQTKSYSFNVLYNRDNTGIQKLCDKL